MIPEGNHAVRQLHYKTALCVSPIFMGRFTAATNNVTMKLALGAKEDCSWLLQLAIYQEWELPELLPLMGDAHADKPRVKNVKLAVDFARHSTNGWGDPALPDDLRAIATLMNIDEETLKLRLRLKKPEGSASA